MQPQEFVNKWARSELGEKQIAQAHFLDVCRLVGVEMPGGDGKTSAGEIFVFEQALKKAASHGFADVYYEGHFAIEYKSPDKYKDLNAAYQQLLQYRENLKNPPLLVVTDINHWEIHSNFPNTQKRVYGFRHGDIAKDPEKLAWLRALFHAPERLHPRRNTEQVTKEAAEAFQLIVDNMRDWNAEPTRIAYFLTKLVFCLFAEDVGLLPAMPSQAQGIFSYIIENSRGKPSAFKQYVRNLFVAMNEGGDILMRDIPYFNGTLFKVVTVEGLSVEALVELERAAKLNWEAIEPSIFGTLFERSLDPGKRAQLGAHYTSRDDILLIVEPVLMQPLRYEWDTVQLEAAPIREQYDSANTGRVRASARNQLLALRERILERIRATTVLDPACGSGNFLYVSLQLLMDLEKEVIQHPLWAGLQMPTPEVHPRQMYGIEIDPIAQALASIVVWIGYIQWRQNNGYGQSFKEPILEELEGNIVCKDAILPAEMPPIPQPLPPQGREGEHSKSEHNNADEGPSRHQPANGDEKPLPPQGREREHSKSEHNNADEGPSRHQPANGDEKPLPPQGREGERSKSEHNNADEGPSRHQPAKGDEKPLPLDGGGVWGGGVTWPKVDVIVGNPPFLGDKMMRGELGDEYVDRLREYYRGRVPGGADLVTYWFEKAREQIEKGRAKRAGLLATNSIRGGANRQVLTRIKNMGDIFMAWSDREWILDGAAVRVSMVGFDNGQELLRVLDGIPVAFINHDLTSLVDITISKTLHENEVLAFIGSQKGGAFDISSNVAKDLLHETNETGQDNADVVKPWVNGADIVRRPREMWIINFHTIDYEQAKLYAAPMQHVEAHVKPKRLQNTDKPSRKFWWLHQRPRPEMRDAMSKADISRFICTPRVAKHRIFVWLDVEVLPDSATVAIARDDHYFFGVLHSKLHEVWSLRMGTSLEDRPRYTPTTTFETFPFPWAPGQEDKSHPAYAAISAAAKQLHAERDAWLNPAGMGEKSLKERTLTNLYNALQVYRGRDDMRVKRAAGDFAPRLDALHRALDEAVCDAYGWEHETLDDEEAILRRLLALNLERAAV